MAEQDAFDSARISNPTESSVLTGQLNKLSNNIVDLTDAIDSLYQNGRPVSQSAARGLNTRDQFSQAYRDRVNSWSTSRSGSRRSDRDRQGFIDAFESSILEGFMGSGFQDDIKKAFQDVAKELGTDIRGIPTAIGRRVGKNYVEGMRSNPRYAQLFGATENFKAQTISALTQHGMGFATQLTQGNTAAAFGELRTMSTQILSAGGQVVDQLIQLGPALVPVVIGFKLLDTALTGLANIAQAFSKVLTSASNAANRDRVSREKNLKLANKRMEDDYEILVKQPFELLREASSTLINTWKNQLTTISATQGYTKADVQDLMSVVAQRLQSEGLASYISGSDIIDNLSRVLSKGLSGTLAEEFAYQATILNKAIPTQDFFSYAETYASIAANAVRSGASQTEAINQATKSLQSFASGLLYASRELTGGFSSGLQSASNLYQQAAQIAQAASSENLDAIASVLLAVQGYVGAIAPDLANSITDTVYQALVGGNASSLVALRSLAGVNASNTEFLREFAKNPQKIFANLFDNLAKIYTDSSDAFMEKAEGYAQLFGLSSAAFQRVDFEGLASAIRNMNTSNKSLNENMELLVEGQTTTTAEQLKAQQINQYMIEEGLSYVIDNQAAQLIQQHMWDEQEARELMEHKYAVDLTGSSLELLEAVKTTVNNILNFLNPLAWMRKIGNLINTSMEQSALRVDTTQLLELGKVGKGNALEAAQLTTYNANLNLTKSLVEMMGGTSAYTNARNAQQAWNQMTNVFNAMTDNRLMGAAMYGSSAATTKPTSSYSWGSVSKSQGNLASRIVSQGLNLIDNVVSDITTAVSSTGMASASASKINQAIEAMLADTYLVEQYVKQGKGFEEWAASGSKYGISDIAAALESAGYAVSDVQNYFQEKETAQGVAEAHDIQEQEKKFREAGIQFWQKDFPTNYQEPLFLAIDVMNQSLADANKTLLDIFNGGAKFVMMYKEQWLEKGWAAFVSTESNNGLFNKFYNEFMNYFIRHTYYSSTEGYTYADVEAIQAKKDAQDRGDTVWALAQMLTKNLVDLQDPTMQTNALLAQILLVTQAIKDQGDAVPGASADTYSIIETLAGQALGLSSNNSTLKTKLVDTARDSII